MHDMVIKFIVETFYIELQCDIYSLCSESSWRSTFISQWTVISSWSEVIVILFSSRWEVSVIETVRIYVLKVEAGCINVVLIKCLRGRFCIWTLSATWHAAWHCVTYLSSDFIDFFFSIKISSHDIIGFNEWVKLSLKFLVLLSQ